MNATLPVSNFSAAYTELIAKIDQLLAMERDLWNAAPTRGQRSAAMGRINQLLDDRARAMRCNEVAKWLDAHKPLEMA